MIKAVIFDCFGVLVREGWLAFRDTYFSESPDKRDQANTAMQRLNAGLLSHEDFVTEIGELTGLTVQEVEEALGHTGNRPDEKLFSFIENDLKPQYKLGILSNAGGDWTEKLFGRERADLFDEKVLSYQVGAAKPEPVMYETIAAKLGVMSEECIFVDDLEVHCDGARNVGMNTVIHEDADTTIARIKELTDA